MKYNSQIYEPIVRQAVSIDSVPQSQGLTDLEGAKAVARRLFDTYDRDRNGQVDNVEVVPMIVDVYKSFNMIFSPSRGDIDSFFKVLDRNNDGRITLQDLEDLCVRYLTHQAPTQMRASEIAPPSYASQRVAPQQDIRSSTYGSIKLSQYQTTQYESSTSKQRMPQVP